MTAIVVTQAIALLVLFTIITVVASIFIEPVAVYLRTKMLVITSWYNTFVFISYRRHTFMRCSKKSLLYNSCSYIYHYETEAICEYCI